MDPNTSYTLHHGIHDTRLYFQPGNVYEIAPQAFVLHMHTSLRSLGKL